MSSYYSDDETEKRLKRLEAKIAESYRDASKEVKAMAEEYFETLKERYDREYEAYQKGKYTDEQFKAWYQTQVQRGKGYEIMADKLAKRMVQADEIASAYINDTTPGIYYLNHSYEAYRIEQEYNMDFHLVDEATVRELMLDNNHTEFKVTSINPTRDYEWNSSQIHKALTAGILQGKSIDKLAESYLVVMKRDENSARRNARTAVTSAQNAGRLKTYDMADEMGIEVKKEWMATLDGRTRDSHASLDGERVDYDKPFSNKLMYPGDPSGAPGEVYNCRCTMRAYLPKYDNEITERAYKVMGDDGKEHREYYADGTPKTFKGTYKDYKKWLKAKEALKNQQFKESLLESLGEVDIPYYDKTKPIARNMIFNGIDPIEPKKKADSFSMADAAKMVWANDMTEGSCISQAYAYIGARAGYDIRDYRGGMSLKMFASGNVTDAIMDIKGVTSYYATSTNDIEAVNKLLKNVVDNKEYLLCSSEHAAIIVKDGKDIHYLDLQQKRGIEARELNEKSLITRFGCEKNRKEELASVLFDVESLYNSPEFLDILRFLNTKKD